MHVNNTSDEARAQASELHKTLVLTGTEKDQIAHVNSANVDLDLAVFEVWPWTRTDDGTLLVAGTCPLCGREHAHGFDSNPLKYPHCTTALPPFRTKPKPLYVRLHIRAEAIPTDLLFAIESERPNLLTMAAKYLPKPHAAKMMPLRDGRTIARKRRKLRPEEFKEACQILIDSGIFDERAAIMSIDGERDERAVNRHLLAQFIRAQGPGRWQSRFVRAFNKAWAMVGRGAQA